MKKYCYKYLQLKKWQKFLILCPISFFLFFGLLTIYNDHTVIVNLYRSIIAAIVSSFIGAINKAKVAEKN